jgi:hypothetical protein
VISTAFGFEKLHSYVNLSFQFPTSISVDGEASKMNSEGYNHLLVAVILNCGVGGVESTYTLKVSVFFNHISSSTVSFTL